MHNMSELLVRTTIYWKTLRQITYTYISRYKHTTGLKLIYYRNVDIQTCMSLKFKENFYQ